MSFKERLTEVWVNLLMAGLLFASLVYDYTDGFAVFAVPLITINLVVVYRDFFPKAGDVP